MYVIISKEYHAIVKWGVNGGGARGYCIFRGKPVLFREREDAEKAVSGFAEPDQFAIEEI